MAKRRLLLKGGGAVSSGSGSSATLSSGSGTSFGTPLKPSTSSYTATYTPPTYTVTTIVSTTIYEPELNFYIPNSEFYINTPAVSVSDVSKSATNFNDGVFYFMNKNNVPIYYNTIDITVATVSFDITANNNQTRRKSVFNPVAKIRASFIESSNKIVTLTKDTENITTDEVYTYVPFVVSYKGTRLGQLILRIISIYYNNPGIMVFPFESIPFSAAFISENVGQLSKLYYGKTIKSPNKNVGTIDFTFNFQYYDSNPLIADTTPSIKYQPIIISLNTVNTGYVPSAISLSMSAPSTGGYTPPAGTTYMSSPPSATV